MMLGSVKCFLRGEEVCSIKVEDFDRDLSVISEVGYLEALALKIKGKCDKQPVNVTLWSDVIEMFCPIRNILTYIPLNNILTIANALKYKRDAMYLLNVARANGMESKHLISEWNPILCLDSQMGRSVNVKGLRQYKPLPDLATVFIESLCDVRREDPDYGIKKVIQKGQGSN
jgi:hypothetical protein